MDYNTKPDIPLEYCLYARKSSESDERQTMSIDSQIEEMMTLAKRDKLKIKEVKKKVILQNLLELGQYSWSFFKR